MILYQYSSIKAVGSTTVQSAPLKGGIGNDGRSHLKTRACSFRLSRHIKTKSPRNNHLITATFAFLFGSSTFAWAETVSSQTLRVLAENCAPSVAPEVMEKLVRAESGFNRFAIGVNGANSRSYKPSSKEEAAQIARDLIAQGHSIDMGLGQINSANLDWLNLTVETVFDSCTNLTASEVVLRNGYDRARKQGSDPQTALHQALSAYNTGTFTRGFSNGYVARVMGGDVKTPPSNQTQSAKASAPKSTTPSWEVFTGAPASSVLVFN